MTPNESTPTMVANHILGYLQALTLRATLLSETLPGTDQPIHFPDLPLITQRKPVILLDDNLAPHTSLNTGSIPIRVLPKDEVLALAALGNDIVYLHFQPPQFQENTIHLSLQAGIFSSDPSKQRLGLSGMRVGFKKENDHWEVFDGPVYFAT
jgi:hypothetical protein